MIVVNCPFKVDSNDILGDFFNQPLVITPVLVSGWKENSNLQLMLVIVQERLDTLHNESAIFFIASEHRNYCQFHLPVGLPMIHGNVFTGLSTVNFRQTKDYLKNHLDYALRVGLHGDFLMNVYFEEHWTKDMAELRSSLNIPPPPERLYKSRSRIHNLTA